MNWLWLAFYVAGILYLAFDTWRLRRQLREFDRKAGYRRRFFIAKPDYVPPAQSSLEKAEQAYKRAYHETPPKDHP